MLSAEISPSQQPQRSDITFSAGDFDLKVFVVIPEYHDVLAWRGLAVVYAIDGHRLEGIEDRALFVTEDQRPGSGMGWEVYDELNRRHGPREPRVRIHTSRRVVQLVRCDRDPNHWWHVMPGGHRDGPFADVWALHTAVGKVVGIYRPG